MASIDSLYIPLPPSTREIFGTKTAEVVGFDPMNFLKKIAPAKNLGNAALSQPFELVSHMRRKRKPRKKKKNILSLKERRELGLYKLRRKDMKYEDFLPLHNLWKEYFVEYMSPLKNMSKTQPMRWENLSRLFLRADYHGAILTVKRSLCFSLVGKKGINVFDTKNTFQLLGDDDVLRIVPKEGSVFTCTIEDFTFTILGNQFCIKPGARNSKKMRNIINMEL